MQCYEMQAMLLYLESRSGLNTCDTERLCLVLEKLGIADFQQLLQVSQHELCAAGGFEIPGLDRAA